jgi:hypothetical protein
LSVRRREKGLTKLFRQRGNHTQNVNGIFLEPTELFVEVYQGRRQHGSSCLEQGPNPLLRDQVFDEDRP